MSRHHHHCVQCGNHWHDALKVRGACPHCASMPLGPAKPKPHQIPSLGAPRKRKAKAKDALSPSQRNWRARFAARHGVSSVASWEGDLTS